jgi:CxxC-x17-CxxC domain-containing protein
VSYQDRNIACRDCNNEFVFSGGEQEFYASKGLMNDPVRCPDCRNARKSARSTLESDSGYVRYGGAASFSGRTPRQMHPATCASCMEMTEVPFIPRGDRPVYCSMCFSKVREDQQAQEAAAIASQPAPAPSGPPVELVES